jgi:hypothetical protein
LLVCFNLNKIFGVLSCQLLNKKRQHFEEKNRLRHKGFLCSFFNVSEAFLKLLPRRFFGSSPSLVAAFIS